MKKGTMDQGSMRLMAAAVREKRREKGLTQKALGEKFELSPTYVGWLELGRAQRLDMGKVQEILSFLGIDSLKYFKQENPEDTRTDRAAGEKAPVRSKETEASRRPEEQAAQRFAYEQRPNGKEKKRFLEWVREKTRIKIRLNNGEVIEGYIKWWDTYSLKFVTMDQELVIPKHSILYYVDAPKKH